MGRLARKRKHHANGQHAQHRTRKYGRDIDQIHLDLKSIESVQKLKYEQPIDEDLPGLGQFYCIPCAKYCETLHALTTHKKSKIHKRQVKRILTEIPYTQEEADRAAGMVNKPTDFSKEAHVIEFADTINTTSDVIMN